MGEDSGDKTEEPTPHKIREARKKGQIAKSQEITSAIMLLVSFYTFKMVGPMMLDRISGHTTLVLSLLDLEFSSALVSMLLMDGLKTILLGLAPLIGMVFIMVIIIESLQTGFLFSLSALSPKFENLNLRDFESAIARISSKFTLFLSLVISGRSIKSFSDLGI